MGAPGLLRELGLQCIVQLDASVAKGMLLLKAWWNTFPLVSSGPKEPWSTRGFG